MDADGKMLGTVRKRKKRRKKFFFPLPQRILPMRAKVEPTNTPQVINPGDIPVGAPLVREELEFEASLAGVKLEFAPLLTGVEVELAGEK